MTLPALPLPDRPSIAVLPFANMSDDPDQEHFADGISEDLITGLVPHPLAVRHRAQLDLRLQAPRRRREAGRARARRALRARRQRAPRRQPAAHQRAAHRRTTGGHHWAERYDRELGDIFAVQDEITRSVAAAIEPQLLAAEGVRALSRSAGRSRGLGTRGAGANACLAADAADYETAIDASSGPSRPIRTTRRREACSGFCLVFAAHMGWIDRDAGTASPAASTSSGRSRSMIAIPGGTSRSAIGH